MYLDSDITIVVPTCERPEMLKQCLTSIKCQTLKPTVVLVMDQSSDDRSELISKDFNVLYHRCRYKNKSKAMNEAIKRSETSWVAIIDDDTILEHNWVEVVDQRRKKFPCIEIIQGNIYASTGYDTTNEDIHDKEEIVSKSIITPLFLIGCNFAFSKTLYNRVGVFNEKLGPGTKNKGGEDIEWGYRVFYKKMSLLICPDLRLIHYSWRTQDDVVKQMHNYGIAMSAVLKIIQQRSFLDFVYYYFKILIWLNYNIFMAFFDKKININTHKAYKNSFKKSYRQNE